MNRLFLAIRLMRDKGLRYNFSRAWRSAKRHGSSLAL